MGVFGVDALPKTVEAYHRHHLLDEDETLGSTCNRKLPVVEKQEVERKSAKSGLINVEPEFVHCSVLFVNPPEGMEAGCADEQLRRLDGAFSKLADIPAPKLEFSRNIRKANIGQGAVLHQIDAKNSAKVATLQQKLKRLFEKDLGWKCRFPKQVDALPGRLHCTLRDSRYQSFGVPHERRPEAGPISVELDKLCITPAAENYVEHSRRMHCGSILSVNFGPPHEVCRSGQQARAIADYSEPSAAVREEQPMAPVIEYDGNVIDRSFDHHPEPARQVDPCGDAAIAKVMSSTARRLADDVRRAPPGIQQFDEATAESHKEDFASVADLPTEEVVGSGDEVNHLEKAFLLRFTLKGMTMEKFKEVLSALGALQPYLVTDAPGFAVTIFVKPHQREAVLSYPKLSQCRPYHVLISESLEQRLAEALKEVATYRNRPRSKAREVTLYGSEHCVKRTFLCDVRLLRNPQSVVQSTTEATVAAINPRRVCDL